MYVCVMIQFRNKFSYIHLIPIQDVQFCLFLRPVVKLDALADICLTEQVWLSSQNFLHRFPLCQLVDQLIQVSDFPHKRVLNLLHPDAADHTLRHFAKDKPKSRLN